MRNLLSAIERFLTELRRRKVYQVALAYVVVGFMVIEAADLTLVRLGLPSWTVTLVVALVGLGFPIALVLAWALEVTPEGVRVEETVDEETEGTEKGAAPASTTRDLWVGASVLVLLLLGGWWYFGGLTGAEQDAVPDGSSFDANRVVVFPFTVGGGEEIAYLGEGMVELMGRSIGGAGPVTAVDPKVVLARVGEEAAAGLSPDSARRIAARLRAGRFVLGSVLQLGEELRLSGTWYAADGRELGSAEVAGQGEDDVPQMVDKLARSAIADLAGGDMERRRRLAAQTTSSVEALKAYLEGQEALRAGKLSGARNAFKEAVEADSTFALAHYRLSLAAAWSVHLDIMYRHQRRALKYSEDLPEWDRRLLQAYSAYTTGEADRAERLYRTVLQRYPDDAEAHYQLGEALYHYNSVQGRSVAEARGPFRRALELDPTFNLPLIHQVQIAVLQEKNAWLDSLTSGLDERDLSPGFETRLQAVRAVVLSGGLDSTLRSTLREANPFVTWTTAYLLMGGEQPAAIDTLAGMLTTPDRPEEVRAAALALQADARAMQGRLRAARRAVARIAPLDSAAYWMGSARLAGLPFVPEKERRASEGKKVMEGLEAWAAGEVPKRLLRAFFLRPRELYPAGRLYHLGLLRARSGEVDGVLQAARELDSADPPFFAPSGPSDLARSVRASVDRRQGRPTQALRHLEAMEHRVDAFVIQGRLYSVARERFVRAELLAEMGRPKEALRWYRTLNGVAYGDLPYIAPAHFGRARVLETLGRPREAAKAYRQVLDLWKEADPVLQSKVEEARQRLATLRERSGAVSATESKSNP